MYGLPTELTCQQGWHTSNENENENEWPLGSHVSLPSVKPPSTHFVIILYMFCIFFASNPRIPVFRLLTAMFNRSEPQIKKLMYVVTYMLCSCSLVQAPAWCFKGAHTEEINHGCRCLLSPLSFGYHTHLPKTHREIVWLLLHQGHLPSKTHTFTPCGLHWFWRDGDSPT